MKDTLQIEFNEKSILTLTENVEKAFQNTSDWLSSEWITVIGMLLVAVITIISQLIITKKIIVSDINKLNIQASSDFNSKSRFEWIQNFRKIIAELMTVTDPDCNNKLNKTKMTFLINQAQLMLDDTFEEEREISEKLSKLGVYSDFLNDESQQSEITILEIQSDIVKKTKKILLNKYKNQ